MNVPAGRKFTLRNSFVNPYKNKTPPFGFNGLGELVYRRTYSRLQSDGSREEWADTIRRVVEGTFNMQMKWMETTSLEWDDDASHNEAEDMFDRFFNMKILPPGRGLWAMGSTLTADRGVYGCLSNCAFISTNPDQAKFDITDAFCFIWDFSMVGVGVGFDTMAEGKVDIHQPGDKQAHVIEDSREGWVQSLRILLNAFFRGAVMPEFNYAEVRPAGEMIRGFGGVSQGPAPLKQLHESLVDVLTPLIGSRITSTAVVDIANLIGRCVVAGNVRRSAELACGRPDDLEFLEVKNYEKNPYRAGWGWASNNSVTASLGDNYTRIAKSIHLNGEPGIIWLQNMRANPCCEQSLESAELCCLVETFPERAVDLDDYLASVLLRNRRIGCSMSGIAQFLGKHGIETLRRWCEASYEVCRDTDFTLSDRWCVPRSIKLTSIKPSGTVSLLSGATPGCHFPESEFYIRRVRIAADSELLEPLAKAGYTIEECVYGGPGTEVVSIPVHAGKGVRVASSVSMWEQLALAAFLQRYYADNQVSCTVTFDPNTEGADIAHALDMYQFALKGISFLPRAKTGTTYVQSPYEAITEEQYTEMLSKLKPVAYGAQKKPRLLDGLDDDESAAPDRYCDGDKCVRL
ncbi:hypothetical protein JKP88DRAFT_260638 [Tribonema minus]|uniref:ribonucleoside-triphosphate reductase (thioredoxin) n=1 Tax=Tribonema minus TaxID=303371 RepID=A0A835Z3U9_9STRA|nr:hypothetical protein JKP88DRAFT_260638 [Tribonema minus]